MLPTSYLTRAIVETKAFAAIVRSTLFFAQENANILRVAISPAEGTSSLSIEATSVAVGDSTSCIQASTDGPAISINLNAKYVAEALSAIDTPEVALEVTQPGRPGVIRPVGADAPRQTYLIMPLFIKEKVKEEAVA